ncbi:hypothetical protein [Savagea faecisuis]|uniref:Uncharacterized protein n=1 Tax=Savagea faecisuis TaxID=1274803 RepID=A0ABW3GU29_9BACL
MAEINYIRYETNTKGKSYSSVAKQMNRDGRTIKKYSEQGGNCLNKKEKHT